MREMFPAAEIFPMYGLTEAFRSTYLDPALVDAHPDSIGTAVPFAELMVLRPDGTETAAEEGGELVHAGPLVAKGYWHDPERTAERLQPAPPASRSGGTPLRSGASVKRDAQGLLYFVSGEESPVHTLGDGATTYPKT